MPDRIAILVPRRHDGGWRDRLWEHCRQIWQKEYSDWPIFEGYHEEHEGPFNRSMAINRASILADGWFGLKWDAALVIDSDTISESEAVRRAVAHALETGDLSIGHDARHMLSRRGTEALLSGAATTETVGQRRHYVRRTYRDSVSCAVAVRRDEWDTVGGFDERFEGWGFEDTAFRIAIETLTDRVIHLERSDCYHLWHEKAPGADHNSPTYAKNHALKTRYERAHFQPERLKAIIAGDPDPGASRGQIPRIIHRTVPAETTDEVEGWWTGFVKLHPEWELKTWRDPLDPADFPLTAHLHDKCANGAQKAGLVRLELLVTHGGVYVDSDVEAVRPLDSLTGLPAFAAWEDQKVVPDAVMGATPGHPAFREMLNRAIRLVEGGSTDAWETGPGVSTAVLPWRDDVLLLPPGSFYPVHYREKQAVGTRNKQPWVFLEHKWHHSWASSSKRPAQKTPVELPKAELPVGLSAVVCMPWTDRGDQRRQVAHDWCVQFWNGVGLPLVEAAGKNRAEMCNRAATHALELGADVLIFADADTWAAAPQVVQAAIDAADSGSLIHAFTRYIKVDPNRTRVFTKRHPSAVNAQNLSRQGRNVRGGHVSGLTAVPTRLWKEIGGFDERFDRWGFEDQAFHLAAEVLGGGTGRVEGSAFHWNHGEDPQKSRTVDPEDPRVLLIQEYCQAAGQIPNHGRVGRLGASGFITVDGEGPDAGQMQAVLAGEGGPLSPRGAVS